MTKPSIIIHDTIIIKDTIYKTITATKIDKAEVYKDILTNQTETYNTIFIVFFGLLALFAGATYLYNTKLAKSQIIKHTDKVFAIEKEKLMKHIKEDFEKELNSMKGESARLFALACENGDDDDINMIVHRFNWWCTCIDYYRLAEYGQGVRMAVDNAIITIEVGINIKEAFKNKLLEMYPDCQVDFNETFDELPLELLNEQTKLRKLFKEVLE